MSLTKKTAVLMAILMACAPLAQAKITQSTVYINNKTNRTWLVKELVKTGMKTVLGYIPGKEKTKEYESDELQNVIIEGKEKKPIFKINRTFGTGILYGTQREKALPYEEWAATLVDKDDPNCTISLLVRADEQEIPESSMGESLAALAVVETGMSFLALISKKEQAEKIRKAQKDLAKWAIPITFTIDLAKKAKAKLSSYVGVKYSSTCDLDISYKSKLPKLGRSLYKNLIFTIQEEEED